MKEQLEQLQVYQAGKTAKDLKDIYNIQGEMLKLSSNENVYGPSPKVKAALTNIEALERYPDPTGGALRQALSDFYHVDPKSILIGSGLDEVIMMLSRAVLTPGTEVLTCEESFVQYTTHALIESTTIKTVPLKDGAFDLEALAEAVSDNTALIWLCNPNNPTGGYFSESQLVAFLSHIPSHIPVVLDEAYAEFVTAEDYPNTLELQKNYPNVIMLRTFSKAYGLASLRVGYAISSPDWTDIWHKVKLPFNVTTLSLIGAEAALMDQGYLKEVIQKNEQQRQRYFDTFGDLLTPSQTNFVYLKTDKTTELNEHLLQHGIIARPVPSGIRITIGNDYENTQVIHALKQYFNKR